MIYLRKHIRAEDKDFKITLVTEGIRRDETEKLCGVTRGPKQNTEEHLHLRGGKKRQQQGETVLRRRRVTKRGFTKITGKRFKKGTASNVKCF